MFRLRRYLLIVILGFVGLFLHGQTIRFEVAAPDKVIEGSPFKIVYTLTNGSGRTIELAKSENLHVTQGPFASNYVATDEESSRNLKKYIETYTYLAYANKEGQVKIPKATVWLENGQKLVSDQRIIHVESKKKIDENYKISDSDAFIKTLIEKVRIADGKHAYSITFRLYSIDRPKQILKALYPDFTGFEIRENPNATAKTFIDKYDGKSYYITDLRSIILTPKRSGKIVFPESEIDILFSIETGEIEQTFWGDIFKSIDIHKKIKIASFTIDAGLIGDYKIALVQKFQNNDQLYVYRV